MLGWIAVGAHALEAAQVAEVARVAEMPVAEVEALLAPLEADQTILDRLNAPYEKKPWHQYRTAFLTEARVAKGLAFAALHADTLARAEAQYGVPKEVVLGILGVETMYGEKMGADMIMTSLFTLGFYSPRGSYFRTELGEYLHLAVDQGWDPYGKQGSYAGAMGMGQFMPSSYRKYAVDFDGDGTVDLFGSPADAIGSVAKYLADFGWETGKPILLEPQLRGGPGKLLGSGLELTHTLASLQAAGVTAPGASELPGTTPARLFSFETATGPEYRVALKNFYVITRYNRSTLYARAVTELAAALAAAPPPPPAPAPETPEIPPAAPPVEVVPAP